MELDPSVELEILNYSSYLEDRDSKKSMMGGMLDTGLRIGKKLVITGFVILSVPMVLPPLLVTSALGFAFSVPFGFVFASYACTEKLMSKLLPSPSRPQMIDYEPVLPFKDEEEIVTIEKEEKEKKEELSDEIEMKIELVKQLSFELSEDENPAFDIVGVHTGIDCDTIKTDDSVVMTPEVTDRKYGEQNAGSAKETWAGSSEEDVKNSLSIIEVPTHDFMENEDEKHASSGKSMVNKNSGVEKITVVKGTDKDKKCQTVSKTKGNSSMEIERRGKKKTFTKPKFYGKKKGPKGDKRFETFSGEGKDQLLESKTTSENNLNVGQAAGEKFGEEREKLSPGVVREEKTSDERCKKEKEHAVAREHIFLGIEGADHSQTILASRKLRGLENNDKNDVGNFHSSLEEEEGKQQQNVVVLKAMRERQSVEDGAEGVFSSDRENVDQSSMLPDDSKYSLEVASLTDMSGLKYGEEMPKLKGIEEVFDADSDLLSDKEQFGDEKIWRQIDAIREIVGLKAPRHPSYFEELKGLYAFTGIEMPSSFLDLSDLSELYNKLQFLKSVIGVK